MASEERAGGGGHLDVCLQLVISYSKRAVVLVGRRQLRRDTINVSVQRRVSAQDQRLPSGIMQSSQAVKTPSLSLPEFLGPITLLWCVTGQCQ